MFSWRAEVLPGVWAAFTNVAAGNLALHVGDDPLRSVPPGAPDDRGLGSAASGS